ncbi:Carboxylic ester hydrolase {ECO:0000256/RuleBase:RU361235} {ECO:0000256/RuleBase:RU361235} [Serendipita indica DSM 11827]|nr:Carboxylic ester hydrolase {ECO:0000256/RuleBase:RU361235} {ECO:0000256/RuleBase:RU361235} [Serendipita indica DSM 11827]
MTPKTLQILVLWLPFAIASLVKAVPVVQTTSGKVKGKAVSNTTNAYLGIPYAQPPVGPLRFLAPRSLLTPSSTRNATSFGLSCIQLGANPPDPSPSGEDCLTINVWTSPSLSPRLKPVLIWIYGGGWNSGQSGSALNDLTSWSTSHPEVVFVSFNYRLNVFGYANSPAIPNKDTNAGLRDQRTAVNGSSLILQRLVETRLRLRLEDSLRVRGVSLRISRLRIPTTYSRCHSYERTGIHGADPPPIPIVGLPAAGPNPFPNIASAVGCSLQEKTIKHSSTAFVQKRCPTDGRAQLYEHSELLRLSTIPLFSKSEYKSRGRAGKFAKIPLLTGTTDNEGDILVVDRTTNTLNETLSDLLTLSVFRCYDSQQSKYSSSLVSVYRYRYMAIFRALSPPPLRSWHASDQIVLFNAFPGLASAATEYLQKAWSAFVVNPSDGLLSLGWKKYNGPGSSTLVDIFNNSTDLQNPDPTGRPGLF